MVDFMYRQGDIQRYLSLFGRYIEVDNDIIIILADVLETVSEIVAAHAAVLRLPVFACKLRQHGQTPHTYGNMFLWLKITRRPDSPLMIGWKRLLDAG